MNLPLLLLGTAQAELEGDASLQLGWLEYADLWAGDPLMGGFDLASPSDPLDRPVFVPRASLTARPGSGHRLRLRFNGRSLARTTSLDEDLAIVHGLSSDGVPVEEAWKERLFLDEASWRWRPDGDPASDLRLGILPYSIGGGRLQAESWPGLRYRLDAARLGWAPLATEIRAASTLRGTHFAALSLRHEPSIFEQVGVEIALSSDNAQGLAPTLEQDLGLLTQLWADTSGEFIRQYQDHVMDGLYYLYGNEADGVRAFHWDLQSFMDLHGSADMVHLDATARLLLGSVLVDAALIHSRGNVHLEGRRFAEGTTPSQVDAHWYSDAPTQPFELDFALRGWAWDLALAFLGQDRWHGGLFFQGMTGDDDLVGKALAGEPVGMFLATDEAFVRTRVFPADSAARSGSLDFPPGVAGYGLVTPGGWLRLDSETVDGNLQLALPMSTHPSPLPPCGRIYGLEADLILTIDRWDRLVPLLEAGVFQPATFFLDSSSDERDHPLDLPLGWRVLAAVTIRTPSG